MTKNLDNDGLRSIVSNYDIFYIDLWGVVHNGITLHKNAIKVLKEITNANKNYVLLTNAPRPNKTVNSFLEKMGMSKKIRENVYSSGQASLNYLKKNSLEEKFYHIGPPRDFDLFFDFKNNKTEDINESSYLLCTGLFEEQGMDLKYYKELFQNHINKKMICTNPDLIVDRGEKRELCAGSVALVFEKMGGEVIYFAKPFPEIDLTYKTLPLMTSIRATEPVVFPKMYSPTTYGSDVGFIFPIDDSLATLEVFLSGVAPTVSGSKKMEP